jgi:hypothetical protein
MNIGLLVCSAVSVAGILAGVYVLTTPDCDGGGICSSSVAAVVGVPLVLLGLGLLAGAAYSYWADWRHGAPSFCIVWACVLLGAAGAVGGAASRVGILLAVLAVGMGAMSVWVTG